MSNDAYLWDKSGDPDPEIVQLERELRRFAAPPVRRKPKDQANGIWRWMAIAAVVVLGVGSAWRLSRPPLSPWQLESGRTLAFGEKITTGPNEQARLGATAVGSLSLEPNTTLQVVRSGPDGQRLALMQGTLHALVWAPAKSFAVDTPAGTSIDLGCVYTLTVDREGAGLVSVSTGWVAFQSGRQEAFIPAGAACRTRRQTGPSLPYFTDASAAFTAAIARWEQTRELHNLLNEARPRDAITLWHLLQRTEGTALRRQVAQRLAALVPAADAAGLERGDPAAINEAWNALGLGSTEWWRTWKHPWAG
jgi:hypothetical protein